MRSAMIVIGVCLIIAIAWGVTLYARYKPELARTQDVVLGLMYFMERHEGRLPASREEFIASEVVEELPDGGLRIVAPAGTRYRKQTHGIPIESLAPFEIEWGADLSKYDVSDRGKVLDENGEVAHLVRWPSSPPSAKEFSFLLLRTYHEVRQRLKDQAPAPATQPAG